MSKVEKLVYQFPVHKHVVEKSHGQNDWCGKDEAKILSDLKKHVEQLDVQVLKVAKTCATMTLVKAILASAGDPSTVEIAEAHKRVEKILKVDDNNLSPELMKRIAAPNSGGSTPAAAVGGSSSSAAPPKAADTVKNTAAEPAMKKLKKSA